MSALRIIYVCPKCRGCGSDFTRVLTAYAIIIRCRICLGTGRGNQ